MKALKEFKNLKRLDIRRTRLTNACLSELREALRETDLPIRVLPDTSENP